MQTPISYYGGKQAILSQLLPLIPITEVYTEIFFGGGTVFFALEPRFNETINDNLDIVINFYRILKTKYRQLKKLIDQSLVSRTMHTEALKMAQRKIPCSNVELAWAFWYTSNFSFSNKIGGGIKYSNSQSICVPIVMKKKKERFTELLAKRIENAQIENDEAIKVLRKRNVKKGFHFIDPPYTNADTGHYKKFTENQLIDLLDELTICKGKFMLTNYIDPILKDYINKNNWIWKYVNNRLANKPDGREVLILNYIPEAYNLKLFEDDIYHEMINTYRN